ncbi:MAG: glycosyltransferase family 39 protein [Candidatus Roizmanbacteria bacterium]|nr:MAG: glycosyltransferase family 39 protein [Candidatus Roizmanbacteria bacterium]
MKKNTATLSSHKIDLLLLAFILLVAVLFRLYKFNTPLADLHSWRQADTAAVARNFSRDGFNLLQPRYDDLSNIQSGIENPKGLRFVEFPIYNAVVGAFKKYVPLFSIEEYGRLTNIIFSLIIIAIIYYLALREVGRVGALIGALVYSIFPFFVFFSRVILPETTALALAMLSIFFLYIYTSRKNKLAGTVFFIASMLSFTLSLLVKPPAVFFAFVLIYLFYKKYTYQLITKIHFYIYFLLSFIPLVLWRYYISFYPEGVPASDWLITSVNTYQGLQNIFFKPAFFRWIFFERINNLILGGFAVFLVILGIVKKQKTWFLYSFLISTSAYLFTFQGGNVQHEYYQVFTLPTLALFAGAGAKTLIDNKSLFNPIISYILIFFIFIFSFYFSYYKVKDYYNYPKELPQIAKIINTLTTKNDKIVTDTLGDTTLLYLSDRKGAPAVYQGLDELKKKGYTYFYTAKGDVIEQIKKETQFKVAFENDKFTLFKL